MAIDEVQSGVVDAAPAQQQDTFADDTTALNEIISGAGEDTSVEEAFGFPEPTPEAEAMNSPANGELAIEGANTTAQPDPNNDQIRYQYWQSEADKSKNELDKTRQTNELLTQQLTTLMSNSQPSQQAQQPEEQAEQFPPPPEKPVKPRTYSREDAYSDSASESARYLDDVESWRDNMDEYNQLQAEYQQASLNADREEYARARERDNALRQQAYDNDRKMGELQTHLRSKYNASDNDFSEFVQVMSNPESLNPDNLWRLFQMDKGQATPAIAQAPSAAFEQTRRAQSVPSPMGVLPSQNVQVSARSAEDKLMDAMIEDVDKLNII